MLRPIEGYIVEGFRDDPDSMAVIEQLLQNYFNKYMASEMDRVRADVHHQQAELLKKPYGFLGSMANASNPAVFDNRLGREIITNGHKDIFLDPEEMVLFCKRQLRLNLGMREDMTLLTQAWRHSALIRIGKEEYDRISKNLGEDLATVYMDYRLSEMILKKMVNEQAPKSTVEYVLRKASEGSLFGIAQSLNKTPMQIRIDQEGEQMLDPGKGAKVTSKALSVVLDAPMTGALTCWGSLIGVGALEVGMEMAQPVLITKIQSQKKQSTVEEILSRVMFHSAEDEFAKMRSQKLDYISQTNVLNTLGSKMHNSPELFSDAYTSSVHFGAIDSKALAAEGQESVFTQSPYNSQNHFSSEESTSVFTQKPYASYLANSDEIETASSTKKVASSNHSSESVTGQSHSSSSEINSNVSSSSSSNSFTPNSSAPKTRENHTTPLSTDQSTPLSSNQTTKSKSPTQVPSASNNASGEELLRDNQKTKSNADKNTSTRSKGANDDGSDEQNLLQNSPKQNSQERTQSVVPSEAMASNENASTTLLNASQDEDLEMASQWAPLIGQFGVGNMKDIGANLGLILATLPDMLFGMFSKKDNNGELSWSKNLIPIASLLLGFKLHNPLLKMLLVGFGGVGLIKNSMDSINSNDSLRSQLQSPSQQQVHFVPYTEQPLNPRIQNLQINNNIIVMDIDKAPYTVTLPDAVAMAYRSKSLPLSTLANAILEKYDQAVLAMTEKDLKQGMHRYNTQMDPRISQHDVVGLK